MSEDDVLFGYRLRVFDYAARTSVSQACRVFGIHRSTYYVCKRPVPRHVLASCGRGSAGGRASQAALAAFTL